MGAKWILVAVLGAIAGLGATTLVAHHAFAAEFDATKPVKLTGIVTKMDWINPHSWIHLDVKAANGRTEKWMIEAGAPNAMFRRGFKKDSLPTGTEVVVDGYRARDGSTKANGRIITFKDGKRLFVSGTDEGAFK